MSTGTPNSRTDPPDREEVELVARGIATAVAPESGLTNVQADLLGAIASALTGEEIDYHGGLPELSAEEPADALAGRNEDYRQRIVHHMGRVVRGLRPVPSEVARRGATDASASYPSLHLRRAEAT